MYINIPSEIQSFFLNSRNRYSESNKGPFRVFLADSDPGKHLGNYHPLLIRKKFRHARVEIVNISKVNADRVEILFQSGESANLFVINSSVLGIPTWLAWIPDQNNYAIGYIRNFPAEISVEEVWEGLDGNSKDIIKKIEKCSRFKKNKTLNTVTRCEDMVDLKIYCHKEGVFLIEVFKFPLKIACKSKFEIN